MTTDALGIALLVVCAGVEGLSQVCFKLGVLRPRRKALWVAGGGALHLAEAVLYTAVLAVLDLSLAYPLSGLTYVATTFLSVGLLREAVSPVRWLGVLLVLVGAGLLATTA